MARGALRLPGLVAAVFAAASLPAFAAEVAPGAVRVDGDRIAEPLTATPGDAARGRAVVLDRQGGNCLACHKLPEPAERFQGDIGPDLAGVGARLDPAQLRLRLVDARRLDPETVMPPYYRLSDLNRVAERYRGTTVLAAQQVEDVIACLASLRN